MTSTAMLLRKTHKGVEALASRRHGPGPRLRSILILVDGKRDVEELGRMSGATGETVEFIGQLLRDGFIEEVPALQAAADSPAATLAPAMTLLQAQRLAVRRLTGLLGPNAEPLCLRIEAARTGEQFDTAVARAVAVVREFRGADLAAAFAADVPALASSAT